VQAEARKESSCANVLESLCLPGNDERETL
jgi:hypothetical protein